MGGGGEEMMLQVERRTKGQVRVCEDDGGMLRS